MPAGAPLVPSIDGLDAGYWEGLANGELRLPRCVKCGDWPWPPQFRCGVCGGWEFIWQSVQASGSGLQLVAYVVSIFPCP